MNFNQFSNPTIALENSQNKNELGQVSATAEEMEIYRQWKAGHPETFTQTKTEIVEQGIEEFNGMITAFEAAYPLDELFAVVDLTADPDRKHPLRDPAKEALKPIFAKLNALKNETNIPDEKYKELKKRWKVVSNAVGMVNKGMVDHNR